MANKFSSKLPYKKGFGASSTNLVIDWYSTVNTDVLILYNNSQYTLHINSYNSAKGLFNITFKELEITKDIYLSSVRNLKLNNIIPKIADLNDIKWYYKIGDIVNDNLRNMKIISYDLQKNKNNHNIKSYLYECLNCGNKDLITEKSLKRGCNCSVCSHTKVVQGINDIATTHPDICIYFVDPSVCKTISIGTRKSFEVICPNCRYKKPKKMQPKTLIYNGIACPKCSDSISFGEKYFLSLLDQLNIPYKYQYEPNWSINKHKYDFYLYYINCIIEVHGLQHYEECFKIKNSKRSSRTLKEEQENDLYKKHLALQNNTVHYIVIDARESYGRFIKNSILNSELTNILNLDTIDWIKCNKDAFKSKLKEACDLYNEMYTISGIAEKLNLNRKTIRHYLLRGSKVSLCNYTPKDSIKESFKRTNKRNLNKPVVCLETKTSYTSIKEASSATGANPINIGHCCRGSRKTTGGFHWMYEHDYKNSSKLEINDIISKTPFIINLDTLELFYSIKEAQEFYGLKGNITLCCQGKNATACGYRWMYYKDYLTIYNTN